MSRNNVEQRFPDEGKSPEKGKSTQEESGKSTGKSTTGKEETVRKESEQSSSEERAPRPRVMKTKSGSDDRHDSSSRPERPYDQDRHNTLRSQRPYDQDRHDSSRPQRPYDPSRRDSPRPQRPYDPSRHDSSRPQRPYDQDRRDSSRPQRPYDPSRHDSSRPQRPYGQDRHDSSRPQRPYDPNRHDSSRPQRPYDPNRYDSSRPQRPYDPNRHDSSRPQRPYGQDRHDSSRPQRPYDPNRYDNASRPPRYPQERTTYDRPYSAGEDRQGGYRPRPGRPYAKGAPGHSRPGKPRPLGPGEMFAPQPHPEGIRINRYIANAGICSRRDADKLVEAGDITVNGVVVNTLGARIDPGDVVAFKGVPIQGERLRYILLNKPKGYITSNDDPEGRATVMELIADCCNERLFPVGRLDKNTTGLLLFTNDGILAEKLMHPRNLVKKLYHIKLDKPLEKEHMKKISMGLKLEDGWIKADQISYVGTVDDRTEVGMEIHSGKNRIVRRIFESFGYEVIKLDRVMFAGLTKKDIRRGKWRPLTHEELNYLKML
ncbi:MAG: pseudouridine synthase [Bacteroidales bacterium]